MDPEGPPLILGKTKKIAEGRKASTVSKKTKKKLPPPPL